MLLGLANACLAFVLGRRLFDSATGLAAAALIAGYWIFIYYEGELHAPVLAVFGTLVLLLVEYAWATRRSLATAFAGGLVLGLYALVRPKVPLVLPVVVGWHFWALRRRGENRRFFATATLAVLGTAAAVAPVTLRNHLAAGDFVLVTTNAGINLYISHNPEATGTEVVIPELRRLTGLSRWTCFEYPALVRGVGRQLGLPDGEIEHSRASYYFTRQAVDFARREAGKTLRWVLRRALLFWGPAEISNDEIVHWDRRMSPLLHRIPGSFPAVLTLALMGAVAAFAPHRRESGDGGEAALKAPAFETALLVALFASATFVSVWPTIAAARYRVPVIPCLILFAAFAIVHWARGWRTRRRRALLFAGAALAVYAIQPAPGCPTNRTGPSGTSIAPPPITASASSRLRSASTAGPSRWPRTRTPTATSARPWPNSATGRGRSSTIARRCASAPTTARSTATWRLP